MVCFVLQYIVHDTSTDSICIECKRKEDVDDAEYNSSITIKCLKINPNILKTVKIKQINLSSGKLKGFFGNVKLSYQFEVHGNKI